MLMLVSASALVFCCGMFCVSDTDFAWRVYEWDCRMSSITPLRLANWRLRVKQLGGVLMVLGVLGMYIGLGL